MSWKSYIPVFSLTLIKKLRQALVLIRNYEQGELGSECTYSRSMQVPRTVFSDLSHQPTTCKNLKKNTGHATVMCIDATEDSGRTISGYVKFVC